MSKGRAADPLSWGGGGGEGSVHTLADGLPVASAESRFLPKAGFSSPGSAIAYSAYVFPDTLVCTTFHNYYVALAVLNTVVSTGLSCYSRYSAVLSQMGQGRYGGGGGGGSEPAAPWTFGGDSR